MAQQAVFLPASISVEAAYTALAILVVPVLHVTCCYSTGMPSEILPHTEALPLSTSPRLDDPNLDVMRRAFAQTLKSGLDPRVMLSFDRSTIERHGGLYYVVVRPHDPSLPPQDVYRLKPDYSIVAIKRHYPRPIKDEIEQAELLMQARRKRSA